MLNIKIETDDYKLDPHDVLSPSLVDKHYLRLRRSCSRDGGKFYVSISFIEKELPLNDVVSLASSNGKIKT